jgi:hypothetical protein
MFTRQQLETATEERCFLCGPCRYVVSRTVGESQLLECQSVSAVESVRELVR